MVFKFSKKIGIFPQKFLIVFISQNDQISFFFHLFSCIKLLCVMCNITKLKWYLSTGPYLEEGELGNSPLYGRKNILFFAYKICWYSKFFAPAVPIGAADIYFHWYSKRTSLKILNFSPVAPKFIRLNFAVANEIKT